MQLFISGIHPFMDLNGIELVTAERRERIHAYIQSEDKARALVAVLLLRRFCGITDDSQLMYGKNGKPYLKNKNIYFNISHSGDYVVLAIADNEVGVDIEKIEPYDHAVAARCFTRQESEWLQSQGTDEAFCRLWTAKESIMKSSGLGFALSPETFCVLPMDESAHFIDGENWFLEWRVHDGHVICCATHGMAEKTEVIYEHLR
jgi:phosphopantetheinyl transferase